MTKALSVILVCMIATVTAFSQTADDIIIRYKGDGKLILTTGETINGKVEFLPSSPGKVEIIPEGQEKETRYKYDEVKEFTVGDRHYFSVKMKGGAVQVGNSTYFALLITPEDAKIRMYMFETQDLGVSKSYYASIPGDETAYALTDLKFTPFKKIIEYVKDCQTLVDKITAKEKGYTIPLTATDDMRKEVFMNISNAHSNCK